MIVASVREIIDAVRPRRSYYTLETMPWVYPDSADAYMRLIEVIDRERFAVHFDPTNLICSPQRYARTGEVIREFVAKLGPHIKSVHAKDITLRPEFMVHLDEVAPGHGSLDYQTLLLDINRLEADVPVMLEHLDTPEEYRQAAAYIRTVATEVGVVIP